MIRPKEKKERALGERLQLKGHRCQSPKCAAVRKPYRPGMHGQKRRRAISDFGRQIQEKQKFKVSYGLNENNLRSLFRRAKTAHGSVATQLLGLLESRLDNVVFRLGFAPSRGMARQLVVHGHITIGDKRVRSPGYVVRPGEAVGVRSSSLTKAAFRDLKEQLKKYEPPTWVELDKETLRGTMKRFPEGAEVPFEVNRLVESFSK